MSEDALRQRFRENMQPLGRLVRIESATELGIPDTCFCLRRYPTVAPVTGWVEFKHEDAYPVRPGTVFKVASLTKDQVNWHVSWALAGGRSLFLIQVGRDLLGFGHLTAGRLYAGEHTRTSFLDEASFLGRGTFPRKEVLKWLTGT